MCVCVRGCAYACACVCMSVYVRACVHVRVELSFPIELIVYFAHAGVILKLYTGTNILNVYSPTFKNNIDSSAGGSFSF